MVPEQIQGIDPNVLLNVSRLDQRDPTFMILDWTVRSLSDRGAVNDGLWYFSGHGQSGQDIKPWSVVLKVLSFSNLDPDPSNLWYVKREYLAHTTGFLSTLPGSIAQAHCYGTSEHGDNAWIWLEFISDSIGRPWGLREYEFAARKLGQFNAAFVTGTPLPNEPWLAKDHVRQWLAGFPQDSAWTNPLVQQSFSPQNRARFVKLDQEKELFLAVLQRLPQVFSHFDFKRSNLFLRTNNTGEREIVAVDWGDCGIGVLGGDLTRLVGATTFFHDWDAEKLAELDKTAMQAYLSGLRDLGWSGDSNLVRLAYCAWFALDWGYTAPGAIAFNGNPENHDLIRRIIDCEPEENLAALTVLGEFALDRADEARRLMELV